MIGVLERKTVLRFALFLVIIVVLSFYAAVKRAEFRERSLLDKVADAVPAVTAPASSTPVVVDYYVEARLERERAVSREEETLRALLADASTDAAAKAKASARLVEIAKNRTAEEQAEALIRSKGFEDALVIAIPNGAVVMVKAHDLAVQDVRIIGDAVMRALGIGPENISISAKWE
ncbi:MAG: SpoIIIAH-like family protein [Bacillota bacterium]